MTVFIAVIILFPLIVAVILKSRFVNAVLALGLAALAIFGIDYKKYMLPDRQCVSNGSSNCVAHSTALVLLFALILIISTVMWYLAFKQKSNVAGLAASGTTRKALTATGWLIIGVVALIVIGFIIAFSQI